MAIHAASALAFAFLFTIWSKIGWKNIAAKLSIFVLCIAHVVVIAKVLP